MSMSARHELLQLIRHQQVVGKQGAILLVHLDVPEQIQGGSLIAALRARIAELGETPPGSMVQLARWVSAICTTDKDAARVVRELGKIGEFLEYRRLGRLSYEIFDMPNDAHGVFAAADKLSGEAPGHMTIDPVDAMRGHNFDALMAMERMLRSADISNLIRERPVYDFTNADNPKVVGRELVVDISEVGRLAKANIHRHAWMLDELTRLLDYRLLAHVRRESSHRTSEISINLHLDSVLSSDFLAFLESSEADQAALPAIELLQAELKAFPEAAEHALKRLKEAGIDIIIDAIPARFLTQSTERLPAIAGGYKFDWRNSLPLDEASFDAAETARSIAPELKRLGPENCVLLHCHTPRVIERALAIGFKRLEGFEIAQFVQRRKGELVRAAVAAAAAAEAARAKEAAPDRKKKK